MKTIEQLLQLSKNPHFTMTKDEREYLDDFLSKKQEKDSKSSKKKSSNRSEENTPVRVRNIVTKTVPSPEDAFEPEVVEEEDEA